MKIASKSDITLISTHQKSLKSGNNMLSISNLSITLGGEELYSKVSFQINEGEKVGLVGPNGTGKSTLFRLIMKEVTPDGGEISFPSKKRLSYFSQNIGEMRGKTAIQEVIEGDQSLKEMKEKLKLYEEKLCNPELSEKEMNSILQKMGEVQTEFEKCGGYDLESRAEEILTGLGIAPNIHHKKVEDFNGGHKMRIALAKTLVTIPDLILMDEPTNYLDMETILWLEEWLNNFKGAILFTTHDRYFMKNIAKRILEVNNKLITSYSGNYDFYIKEKEIRLKQLKSEFSRQQDKLAKEEEFIAKFKARASHAAQVQSRVKKIEKIERVELPPEEESIAFEFATPKRGGDDVAILTDLAKGWKNSLGDEISVFSGLTATIRRPEKIAVVGVNGAGKSTLLKVIAGKVKPSEGHVTIGPSIQIGYFGQFSFENLVAENTVLNEVSKYIPHQSDGYTRNLLAAFLFKGDDVKKKVKFLSGGEKSRLILAGLLAQNNNFLILDEPTNHLDIKSREILLSALQKYEGTILFVSHDRYFLNHLAEKVFEVDQHKINLYPGPYKDYLDHIKRRK